MEIVSGWGLVYLSLSLLINIVGKTRPYGKYMQIFCGWGRVYLFLLLVIHIVGKTRPYGKYRNFTG